MEMVACVICTLLIHADVLSCPICGSRQSRRCTTTSKTESSSVFRKKKAEAQEKEAMQEIKFKIQASQKEEEKIKADNYFNTQIQRERQG